MLLGCVMIRTQLSSPVKRLTAGAAFASKKLIGSAVEELP